MKVKVTLLSLSVVLTFVVYGQFASAQTNECEPVVITQKDGVTVYSYENCEVRDPEKGIPKEEADVTLLPTTVRGEVVARSRKVGGISEFTTLRLSGVKSVISSNPQLEIVRLSVEPGQERAVSEALRQLGYIAEPNYIYTIFPVEQGTPTDPNLASQWALRNLQVLDVWQANLITATQVVTIAVIDTGCGPHVDLPTPASSWNTINDSANAADDEGHGSHVTGIIAMKGDNGIGGVGVTYGINVNLMCIKALNSYGNGTTTDLAEAVDWAHQHGADIINASWKGEASTIISQEIAEFIADGGIFIAAMGNDSKGNPNYPANDANVWGIGAVDANDRLATFSSWGATDFVSPGVSIYSTIRNNQYEYYNGTSMATPYMTGLVAIIKATHPDWSSSQIYDFFVNHSDDLWQEGDDPLSGHGRPNLARMFGLPGRPTISVLDIQPKWLPPSGGTVAVELVVRGEGLSAATLVLSGTQQAVANPTSFAFAVPANSTMEDKNWPARVEVTSTNGLTNSLELGTLTVFAPANAGRLTWQGTVAGYNTQSDDVSWSIDPFTGYSIMAQADYYLGQAGLFYQTEPGRWGPQLYTRISGGSSNGLVGTTLNDFTGDGIPDWALCNRFNGIGVFTGRDAGSMLGFSSTPIQIPNSHPNGCKGLDVDGDGTAELVWTDYDSYWSRHSLKYVSLVGGTAGPVHSVNVSLTYGFEEPAVMATQTGPKIGAKSGGTIYLFDQNLAFSTYPGCWGFEVSFGYIDDNSSLDFASACPGSARTLEYYLATSYARSQAASPSTDGNWGSSEWIRVGGQSTVYVTDQQFHRLLEIPFINGTPQLPPHIIASATLPDDATSADVNRDGYDDLIGGLAGYVSPYGAPIMMWLQTPFEPLVVPLANISLAGPTEGRTNALYTLTTTYQPLTATLPITYTFYADEQSSLVNQTGVATFSWTLTGTKVITVEAQNVSGEVVSDTHFISLKTPLTSVSLAGPAEGWINAVHTFTTMYQPLTATLPITYTFYADGQSLLVNQTGVATFSWALPGTKMIMVVAQNIAGEIVSGTHSIIVEAPLTSVSLTGPTEGRTNALYAFTPTYQPLTATLPITYTFYADEQSPLVNLTGTATFSWTLTGTKVITVEAQNITGETVSDTHSISIKTPVASVTLAGPTEGQPNTLHTFIATYQPVTATLPITYTIFANEQWPAVNRTGVVIYSWMLTGTKIITVEVQNIAGEIVSDTHSIHIDQELSQAPNKVYLPILLKN